MKLHLLFSLFLALGLAPHGGCSRQQPSEHTCNLKVGGKSSCGRSDLDLQFTRTLSDSRCPKDVSCVWAGEAVVELMINGKPHELRHSPGQQVPDSLSVAGYVLKLLELKPYPVSGKEIEANAYEMEIMVRKE